MFLMIFPGKIYVFDDLPEKIHVFLPRLVAMAGAPPSSANVSRWRGMAQKAAKKMQIDDGKIRCISLCIHYTPVNEQSDPAG